MDPINQVVKHIARAKYTDLPPSVVEVVKKSVIDTMGAALAGSSAPIGRIVAETVRQWAGRGDSTVVVYGDRVPAHNAALANCVMARCVELDDVHKAGGGHVSVVPIPSAFAIAEYAGTPVSGKDFILACAIGGELTIRLRMAAGKNMAIGWLAETLAPLTVVATGARLLRMDEEQILNGMGIAYMQCSGNPQSFTEGRWSSWLPAGNGAAAGIASLELARKGLLGTANPLMGKFGLYPLYFRGEYDEAILLGELGKKWEVADVSIKAYPSCGFTHHAIYTTIKLVQENDIEPGDIEGITVTTYSYAASIAGFDSEGKLKHVPRDPFDAQFSIPYAVATAVVKRRVFLEDFTESAIRDPHVLAVSRKVNVTIDPARDKVVAEGKTRDIPVEVEIRTKGGKVYTGCEEYFKGHPKNPFTLTECADKFMSCARISAKPLSPDRLSAFIRLVESLDEIQDVAELMQYLI